MFMSTPNFKFLDILNYLGPGTSYEKWVKTYGSSQTKSWLQYEWFDREEKLDYERLPPYCCWYSKLKNGFSPEGYVDCQHLFQKREIKTFAKWLEYYNNLDVGPFLEVMEKMRGFYVELGLDTFKDVVSLQYLMRGTLRGPNVPPGAVRTKRGGVQNVERGSRGEGQTWFLLESTRQARPRFEVISTTTQRLPKGFWVMS